MGQTRIFGTSFEVFDQFYLSDRNVPLQLTKTHKIVVLCIQLGL